MKSFASPEGELAFALNLVAALLVSYHAFVQDMSLLFMAILCAECSFLQPSLSRMATKNAADLRRDFVLQPGLSRTHIEFQSAVGDHVGCAGILCRDLERSGRVAE